MYDFTYILIKAKKDGVIPVLLSILRFIVLFPIILSVKSSLSRRKKKLKYFDYMFDKNNGTDTFTKIGVENIVTDKGKEHGGFDYVATPNYIFLQMMRNLSINFSKFYFIDVGSGKGRMLLLSSQFNFKKIIGVEYSSKISSIAKNNISLFKKKNRINVDIDLVCEDIIDFDFPKFPLLFYLYNPFDQETVAKFTEKLEKFILNEKYEVWILYYTPHHSLPFDESKMLEVVHRGKAGFVYKFGIPISIDYGFNIYRGIINAQ